MTAVWSTYSEEYEEMDDANFDVEEEDEAREGSANDEE